MTRAQRRNSARAQGFTLIEVLAAVSILGLSLVILLESQWTSISIHNTMNEEVTLSQLVESVVGKAEIGVLSGQLNDSGDFGDAYPDYNWTYDAAESASSGLGDMGSGTGASDGTENRLYEVQLTVNGPQGDKQLTFYVYDNNAEDSQDQGIFNKNGSNFGKRGRGLGSGMGR